MDDPWGSPWATTDTTAPSTSPSKHILEPPPPAFLSAPNSLTLPSSQSAWLDDNAYSEWASPDPAPAVNASPWTWGNESASVEGLTPSYEPRRKSSTPKWPQSRSPSPGLGPSMTSNNATSPGQPSPDPWANHVSTYTRDDPEPLAQLPRIPEMPPAVPESAQVGLGLTNSTNPFEQDFVTHEPTAAQFADPIHNSAHEHPKFNDTPASDRSHPTIKHADDADPSSASASSEDGGDNDEASDTRHADSPMTSVEDNAAPKTSQRKTSAKRRTSTPERIMPRRSASREPEAAAADPETKKEALPHDGSTHVDSRSLPDDRDEATGHNHDPFDIDLGKLDLLLPGTSEEVPRPTNDVSDRIRKMWYRLSRNESLRKHNAGDDDNYIFKTVRRWMEEDSFGGRAFRGVSKGNTGSKNFGWDATTAASPVDLDRVFGRKQKRQQAVHRPTSTGGLPPLSTVPMVPLSTGNTPISAQENGNWEGLAAFGWSSGAGDMKAATEAKASKPSAPGIPLPLAFTGFDNKPKSHASLPAFIKPIVPTPPTVKATSAEAEEADEGEEEWGDMVSPTTPGAADSASLPKTSWDSFSTNPLSEVTSIPLPDSFTTGKPDSDALRTGFTDDGNSRDKSGRGNIGSVISPAPAPTLVGVADIPQSLDGYSANRCRLANSGKLGFKTGGLVETGLATTLHTTSTAQPRNSTEGIDIVHQFVRSLPDLSYMLR
ncbi:hypothetical protein LX36DRAFT_678167 [Colletotrichum falcatum]|nr:hypothetical protein LX36DRAFT_678167 [Colletotrichum falcatum]